MKKIIVLLLGLSLIGCDSPTPIYPSLNSTIWMQSSAEYVATVTQAFNSARMHMDEALRDKNWTAALEQKDGYQNLPPAVIFDVDETVLDNGPYEAYLVDTGMAFHMETWEVWVEAAKAEPVHGVKELIADIKSQGIDVFYITNRIKELEAATVKNLRSAVDADVSADNVLFRGEYPGGNNKSNRRAAIAETHRVIMIFGDDYNDFRYLENSPTPEQRMASLPPYDSYWGSKWIMLSNPRYGHWEWAIYNYAYDLPDDEKLQAKQRHLNVDSGASDM